jgi:uncharacterized protein (TIGR02453 family)
MAIGGKGVPLLYSTNEVGDMNSSVDLAPVLRYLKKLAKNNDRAWFEANREEYETARARFEDFVAALIIGISEFHDLGGVEPKDCLFRIHRDVRFSKDKSPYKTAMAASIGAGGRKSKGFPYYIHVQPGNQSVVAGGCYDATSEQLNRWRAAVDKNPAPVKRIVGAKDFIATFGGLSGETLVKAPRGYPADHPELDLLRLKQVIVMHDLSDEDLVGPAIVRKSVGAFKTMKPFLDYLGSIL